MGSVRKNLMEGTYTIVIERPTSLVFDFIMDVEKIPVWQLGSETVSVTGDDAGRFAVGTIVSETRKILGQTMNVSRRVVEIEAGRHVKFVSESGSIYPFTVAYEVAPEGDSATRVTILYDADTGAFFATAEPLLRPQAEKVFTANLVALKAALEADG